MLNVEEWDPAAERILELGIVLVCGRRLPHSALIGLVEDDEAARAAHGTGPDETATDVLMHLLARLWEEGWQPLDAVHVVGRKHPRLEALTRAAIREQSRRSSAVLYAPDMWRDQLDQLFDVAEGTPAIPPEPIPDTTLFDLAPEASDGADPPDPSGALAWTVMSEHSATGWSRSEAWMRVLTLIGVLYALPPMPRLVATPSQWHDQRRAPGASRRSASHDSKVRGRIRNLLAKAEATPYAAEAEALTAKAQDLMTRHSIDEALLQDEGGTVAIQSTRVHIVAPYAAAKAQLLHHIGEANRARVVWSKELAIATVVGTPVDVQQVEMLFTSLLVQATHAMLEEGRSTSAASVRTVSFRKSFLLSYAARIGERLADADAQATAAESAVHGRDLVPLFARQAEAIDGEFDRHFPHLRTGGTYSVDPRGWEAGRRAADRAVF